MASRDATFNPVMFRLTLASPMMEISRDISEPRPSTANGKTNELKMKYLATLNQIELDDSTQAKVTLSLLLVILATHKPELDLSCSKLLRNRF